MFMDWISMLQNTISSDLLRLWQWTEVLPTSWQTAQGFILHKELCPMILLKKCSNINAWNYVTGLSLTRQTVTPAINSSQCLLHS